jgi:hypothetical protein
MSALDDAILDAMEEFVEEGTTIEFAPTAELDAITPAVVSRFIHTVLCHDVMFLSDLSEITDFGEPPEVYWERTRQSFGVNVAPRRGLVDILRCLDQ